MATILLSSRHHSIKSLFVLPYVGYDLIAHTLLVGHIALEFSLEELLLVSDANGDERDIEQHYRKRD